MATAERPPFIVNTDTAVVPQAIGQFKTIECFDVQFGSNIQIVCGNGDVGYQTFLGRAHAEGGHATVEDSKVVWRIVQIHHSAIGKKARAFHNALIEGCFVDHLDGLAATLNGVSFGASEVDDVAVVVHVSSAFLGHPIVCQNNISAIVTTRSGGGLLGENECANSDEGKGDSHCGMMRTATERAEEEKAVGRRTS